MVKTTSLLLAILPLISAQIRGTRDTAEVTRILKGGGKNGGGSGSSCPDPDDAPGILCRSNADCEGSPFCEGREDCCCVAYTYSYCGVPSDCNQYLQCLPPQPEPIEPVPYTAGAAANAFELLAATSECLADFVASEVSADSEDMAMSGSGSSKGNGKGMKYAKGMGKISKVMGGGKGAKSGSGKGMKKAKKVYMPDSEDMTHQMDSEDMVPMDSEDMPMSGSRRE